MATTDQHLDELVELERAFWDASSRADGGFYRDNCTGDALFVFFFGILGRDACAGVIDANETPWARYSFESVKLVDLGDAAILSYRATARHEGAAEDMSMFVSSVYRREDGSWRMALHQQPPPRTASITLHGLRETRRS